MTVRFEVRLLEGCQTFHYTDESLEAIIEFEQGRKDRGLKNLNELAGDKRGRAGIINIGGSLAIEVDVRDVTDRKQCILTPL